MTITPGDTLDVEITLAPITGAISVNGLIQTAAPQSDTDLNGDGVTDVRISNGLIWLAVYAGVNDGNLVNSGGVEGEETPLSLVHSYGYAETVVTEVTAKSVNKLSSAAYQVVLQFAAGSITGTQTIVVTIPAGERYAIVEDRLAHDQSTAVTWYEPGSHIGYGKHIVGGRLSTAKDVTRFWVSGGSGDVHASSEGWYTNYAWDGRYAVLSDLNRGRSVVFGFAGDQAQQPDHVMVAFEPFLLLYTSTYTQPAGTTAVWRYMLRFVQGAEQEGEALYLEYARE